MAFKLTRVPSLKSVADFRQHLAGLQLQIVLPRVALFNTVIAPRELVLLISRALGHLG